MIKLVFPDRQFKKRILRYREEFLKHGEHMHGGVGLSDSETIDHWLRECTENRDERTVHRGHIPNTVFLALDENEYLVGMVNIRHHLNDYYEKYGGHIGYGVRPSERGKGYAKQMLTLALIEASKLGLEKVLLTCSTHNVASAKTIRHNGGILESEIFDPHDQTMTERYWITVKEPIRTK